MSENEQNEFSEDLSAFDEQYDGVEPAENKDFEPVPNGSYQAKIDKAYLSRAKNSNNLMLKWELVIISGKFENRRLFRNNMIVTEENLKWLKTDLGTVGVTLKKTSELPGKLDELLDVVVKISVKNKKSDNEEYDNNVSVYINKKLDVDLPEKFQGSAEDSNDNNADTPF